MQSKVEIEEIINIRILLTFRVEFLFLSVIVRTDGPGCLGSTKTESKCATSIVVHNVRQHRNNKSKQFSLIMIIIIIICTVAS